MEKYSRKETLIEQREREAVEKQLRSLHINYLKPYDKRRDAWIKINEIIEVVNALINKKVLSGLEPYSEGIVLYNKINELIRVCNEKASTI